MSKEDRYSHLGNGTDEEPDIATNASDADNEEDIASPDEVRENGEVPRHETDEEASEAIDGIRITVSDSSEEEKREIHIKDEGLTIDDLEDNVEDLFNDLYEGMADDESATDIGETSQSSTSDPISIYSPLAHGIHTLRELTRAMIRSGSIGVSTGVAWMATFLGYRRHDG